MEKLALLMGWLYHRGRVKINFYGFRAVMSIGLFFIPTNNSYSHWLLQETTLESVWAMSVITIWLLKENTN